MASDGSYNLTMLRSIYITRGLFEIVSILMMHPCESLRAAWHQYIIECKLCKHHTYRDYPRAKILSRSLRLDSRGLNFEKGRLAHFFRRDISFPKSWSYLPISTTLRLTPSITHLTAVLNDRQNGPECNPSSAGRHFLTS